MSELQRTIKLEKKDYLQINEILTAWYTVGKIQLEKEGFREENNSST